MNFFFTSVPLGTLNKLIFLSDALLPVVQLVREQVCCPTLVEQLLQVSVQDGSRQY